MFAERIEKVKKTKIELELIKTVDCFLDGHGDYDSNLVPSRIKFSKQTIFFVTVSESTQRIQIAS